METQKTEVLVRKNLLAQLFNSALQSKANLLAKRKALLAIPVEFAGQHNNDLRRVRNSVMKARHITGKQFRRLVKKTKRDNNYGKAAA